jgi:hypothetical protein
MDFLMVKIDVFFLEVHIILKEMHLKIDGSLLFNYLIILSLKKYKGNEFMSIYSSTVLNHPLCIHSTDMNIAFVLRTFNGIKSGARGFTIQEGDNVIILKQTNIQSPNIAIYKCNRVKN